jgi:hypothetical protein
LKDFNIRAKREDLSAEALLVWNGLDAKTRKEIQKWYRPKIVRNQKIRELKLRGVTGDVLAEITGMNRSSVFRVIKRGYIFPDYVKEEMKGLIRAFEYLLNCLTKILNGKKHEHEKEDHKVCRRQRP